MDFGQILDPTDLARLSFELPALTSPEEEQQLARVAKASARSAQIPQIYIGVPIFAYPAWAGSFYPEGTDAADFLKAYSQQLRTVELNSTFYAIPAAETFTKWKASVGSDFKFCPKFPKSISHSLDGSHPDLKVFLERVQIFGENLGVCFLQLPNYFSAREQDRLMGLLSSLPRELRTVVEFRNQEFFSDQRLKAEWVEKIASKFVGSVCLDTPGERGIAHVSLTSTRVMIRFLGANLHASDFVRLKEWAKRVALWHVTGLKEIYFMVHEPDNGTAPLAAKRMVQWVNEELEVLGSGYRVPALEWYSFFDEIPG